MFKTSSFEDEIYLSMEKSLTNNQVETNFGFNKLAKAADFLNEAAAIFEQAGMYKEAAEIVIVLQNLTRDLG